MKSPGDEPLGATVEIVVGAARLSVPSRRVHLQHGADFYATLRTSAALERAEVAIVVLDVTEPISVQDLKIIDLVLESGRALVTQK